MRAVGTRPITSALRPVSPGLPASVVLALVQVGRPPRVHRRLHQRALVLTAQSGATLSDLMARMGHASTRAASIYLHTPSDRDLAVAAALDRLLPPRASGT
jgi:hypothetical protein